MKSHSKVWLKIEQIARLRVAGVRDARIADILNLTTSGLSRILRLPEYREMEQAVLMGTVTKMDEALAGRADEMRHHFRTAVPAAMRALLDAVTQRRDTKASISAASEILDRDPDHVYPKGRRTDASPQGEAIFNEQALSLGAEDGDEVADSLTDPKKVN